MTDAEIEAIETCLTLMRQQVLEGWDNQDTVDALQGLLDRAALAQQAQPRCDNPEPHVPHRTMVADSAGSMLAQCDGVAAPQPEPEDAP